MRDFGQEGRSESSTHFLDGFSKHLYSLQVACSEAAFLCQAQVFHIFGADAHHGCTDCVHGNRICSCDYQVHLHRITTGFMAFASDYAVNDRYAWISIPYQVASILRALVLLSGAQFGHATEGIEDIRSSIGTTTVLCPITFRNQYEIGEGREVAVGYRPSIVVLVRAFGVGASLAKPTIRHVSNSGDIWGFFTEVDKFLSRRVDHFN